MRGNYASGEILGGLCCDGMPAYSPSPSKSVQSLRNKGYKVGLRPDILYLIKKPGVGRAWVSPDLSLSAVSMACSKILRGVDRRRERHFGSQSLGELSARFQEPKV